MILRFFACDLLHDHFSLRSTYCPLFLLNHISDAGDTAQKPDGDGSTSSPS